jgi:multipile epidermal growth factor-like domains protein 8
LSLVNSTLIDFSGISSSLNEPAQSGEVVAKLSGFLRLPQESQKELLKVCGSFAQITLKTSSGDETMMAANFTAEQNHCVNFLLQHKKVLIDLQAKRRLTNLSSQQHYQSKVGLQNNATKAFTFEFLEPFSNGNCNHYSNCLLCLSDNACAWCDIKNICLSREVNETSLCRTENHWRYLILQPQQCENCSNSISCEDCTSRSKNCEWWLEETKCVRKGRSPNGIKSINECPSPCNQRKNCSTCLNEKNRCVWCEETKECFR